MEKKIMRKICKEIEEKIMEEERKQWEIVENIYKRPTIRQIIRIQKSSGYVETLRGREGEGYGTGGELMRF